MTQLAGTFNTGAAIGNREDLENDIYNVDPMMTPVMNAIGRTDATARQHDWQTQALAAAGSNAAIEGDDFTNNSVVATARPINYCQILTKTIGVSGTQEAVEHAGRASEMGYQLELKSAELKRDIEWAIMNNQAPVNGDGSTTASVLRPFASWYSSNVSRGANGANGTTTTAATDGTPREFTEDLLQGVIRQMWDSTGMVQGNLIVTGSFNRTKIDGFTGGNNRTQDMANSNELQTSIRVYRSSFGDFKAVLDNFVRTRDVHVLKPEMAALAYLRTFRTEPLAKTGDTTRNALLCEVTLVNRNEKAHGIVADLTTA